MTSSSVSSSVEVSIDPLTAFTVFTEEIAYWWVQGPINFYDSRGPSGYGSSRASGGV